MLLRNRREHAFSWPSGGGGDGDRERESERESLFHFRGGILCLILLFITLGFGSDSFGGIGRNFLRQESILSVVARFVSGLNVF